MHNDKDPPEWVVDPEQEIVAATNAMSKAQANVINVKKTDKEVFAALTVDSFCAKKNSSEHEEEDRSKNDNLWTQVKPKFQSKCKIRNGNGHTCNGADMRGYLAKTPRFSK